MAKPLKETLTDIANAIREKDGTTTTMTSQEMPARIKAIPSGVKPSGTLIIQDTYTKNVTNYEYAQVKDALLIPSNIKKGVAILGITGTLESGAGAGGYVDMTDKTNVTYNAGTLNLDIPLPNNATISQDFAFKINIYVNDDDTETNYEATGYSIGQDEYISKGNLDLLRKTTSFGVNCWDYGYILSAYAIEVLVAVLN